MAGPVGGITLRALDSAGQHRRLWLAAAILRLPAAPALAAWLDTLRRTSVLGLADFPATEGRERLRLQLAAAAGSARAAAPLRRLTAPAAFAEFAAAVEPLAAAWFTAGVRLLSVPELCDERAAVRPLNDPTPALVWVAGSALSAESVATHLEPHARFALVHSRKGRALHSGLPWVRATAAAVDGLPELSPSAVCIGGVQELPARMIRAAAVARGLPVFDVLTAPLPAARAAWLQHHSAEAAKPSVPPVSSDAGFMPAALTLTVLWPDEALQSTGERQAARSLRRDDLVLALAHQAIAITLRAGGNWQQRLLRAASEPSRRERIAAVDPAVWKLADRGAAALLAQGCRCWPPVQPPQPSMDPPSVAVSVPPSAPSLPALPPVPSAFPAPGASWPWLTHWTRRPDGPWPLESDEAWLQRVLAGDVPAEPTALDTLIHILTERCLIGGRQFLRHGPAVCFTHWPPGQLATMAQRHRGLNRPLYEPFGLGFRREYLERKAAVPALYGDEAVWTALDPAERFRFQFEGDAAAPWSVEGEWRLPGDLDFSDASPADLCLFLPTAASASMLAQRLPTNPFPIVPV